jgi:hypothetical protein
MATKKKQAKSKKKAPKKKTQKKLVRKSATPKKKPAKKKPSLKTAAAKSKIAVRKKAAPKKAAPKKASAARKRPSPRSPIVDIAGINREGLRARSGGQSGDLQGLSNMASAESESVDELLEEGNAFEADVVKGVEDAGDEGEVHTHEVPEDDVPEEYLDPDKD